MRHLLTVGRNTETQGCYWVCSCGVESKRKDLSWARAQSGARAHEDAAGLPPAQVLALYTALKWVFILFAFAAPLVIGYRFGTEAMLWCAGAEAFAAGACVLDHVSSLADQRAETYTLQDL